MSTNRVLPRFKTEAEEAEWWFQNRQRISRDLKNAAKAGEVKILTKTRLQKRLQATANSRSITKRIG